MPMDHVSHGDDDIAYHVEWEFRRDALIYDGEKPVALNFSLMGAEFRRWMLRTGSFTILTERDKDQPEAYSNPYTYHASSLATVFSSVINDAHAFSEGDDDAKFNEFDAESQRIRLSNELTLYSARFCEVLIKQLLYCTQIPRRRFKNASLGTLLSSECKSCKSSGMKRHKISLLGSLAHRYRLCIEYEQCLAVHLRFANRRRNTLAAHSESLPIVDRPGEESRNIVKSELKEILEELIHMLSHIGDLETLMANELQRRAGFHGSLGAQLVTHLFKSVEN